MNNHTLIFQSLLACGMLTALSACNGQIYTTSNLPKCISNGDSVKDNQCKIRGIVYYPPRLFILSGYYINIRNEKGKITHNYLGLNKTLKCSLSSYNSLVIQKDTERPLAIVYEPGILEKNEFTVTFEDGQLKSVGVKQEPDRGETLKNLSETAVNLTKIARPLVASTSGPSCTHDPVIESRKRYEKSE